MMINPEGVDEGGASVIAIDPGAPGSDVVDAEVSLADHGIAYPAGYAVRGTSVWALGMTLTNGRWDEEPGFLVEIDVATGRELARTDVGRQPRDVIVAFGHVWVSNSADDTLLRLDPRSLDVVQTIETGDGPSRILAAFGSLWLETEYHTPTVQRIDPETGTIIATIEDVVRPIAATGSIWVGGPGPPNSNGAIREIDPRNNRLVGGGFPLDVGPGYVAAGANAMWIGKWYPVVPGDWYPYEGDGGPVAYFAYRFYDRDRNRLMGPRLVVEGPTEGVVAFGSLWVPHLTKPIVLRAAIPS
jgi:DNA-binding beta-propeller fold protein YncE